MRELSLNNNAFAKQINTSPTVTFNVISGRMTKPSYDLLEKIVFTFDNVSCEWLLRGEGDMFKNKSKEFGAQIKKYTPINNIDEKDSDQSKKSEQEIEIEFLRRNLEQVVQTNNKLLVIIEALALKSG